MPGKQPRHAAGHTRTRGPRLSGSFESHGAPEKSTSQTTDAHKIVSESARLFGEAPQPNRPSSMIRTLLLALLGAAAAQEVQMEVRAGVLSLPLKKFTPNRNTTGARGPAAPAGLPEAARAPCGPARPTAAPATHTNNLHAPTLPAPTFKSPHRSPPT